MSPSLVHTIKWSNHGRLIVTTVFEAGSIHFKGDGSALHSTCCSSVARNQTSDTHSDAMHDYKNAWLWCVPASVLLTGIIRKRGTVHMQPWPGCFLWLSHQYELLHVCTSSHDTWMRIGESLQVGRSIARSSWSYSEWLMRISYFDVNFGRLFLEYFTFILDLVKLLVKYICSKYNETYMHT
jgi:hypothetical protein